MTAIASHRTGARAFRVLFAVLACALASRQAAAGETFDVNVVFNPAGQIISGQGIAPFNPVIDPGSMIDVPVKK